MDQKECKSLRGNVSRMGFNLTRRKFQIKNPEDAIIKNYRLFQASTSIYYMIAKFRLEYSKLNDQTCKMETAEDVMQNFDPIAKSFVNARMAHECMKNNFEHGVKFQEAVHLNSEFASEMLDLCNDPLEAEILLTNKMLPDEDFDLRYKITKH